MFVLGVLNGLINELSNTFNSKAWKLLPSTKNTDDDDNDGNNITSKDWYSPEVSPFWSTSIMVWNSAKCYFGRLLRVERVISDIATASIIIFQAQRVRNSTGKRRVS